MRRVLLPAFVLLATWQAHALAQSGPTGVALPGGVEAELRFEVFNVFDTVNFGMPENNFDSTDFGRITTTLGGPRVSQFGLRLSF